MIDKDIIVGLIIVEGICLLVLYKFLMVGGFFVFIVIGIVVYFVLILKDSGIDLLVVVGVVFLIGIFLIIGRFGIGFLFDWFFSYLIGVVVFVIFIFVCFLLIYDGSNLFS